MTILSICAVSKNRDGTISKSYSNSKQIDIKKQLAMKEKGSGKTLLIIWIIFGLAFIIGSEILEDL